MKLIPLVDYFKHMWCLCDGNGAPVERRVCMHARDKFPPNMNIKPTLFLTDITDEA